MGKAAAAVIAVALLAACTTGSLPASAGPTQPSVTPGTRAFDELLERAAGTVDIDSQLALHADAQRLLVEDPAAIFLQ